MDFAARHQAYLVRIETGLDSLLPAANARPARLHEAMRYSLQAGGKRLRPVLVLAAADLVESPPHDPLAAAVAVECLHTYSLIHDDLPCMDNDDLRRGRPTCHRAFDEATALLAGDALLTHAFRLLSASYAATPAHAHALIHELSHAASSEELIGGQMEDLLAEKQTDADAKQLVFIHLNKTAAMIRAALVMGGLCANLPLDAIDALRTLGRELGLTFQIVDDILDATSDSATLGKTVGKDVRDNKVTFIKLYGLDGARRSAREHTDAALAALDRLPGDTAFLRALIKTMLERKN